MRDLLPDYEKLSSRGEPVGRAVVTSVWGSAPRPEGACMLATAGGAMVGSVSGGCVETATAVEIAEAIARGTPRLVTFGVSDEKAWEVGLACGGTIKVFIEPTLRPQLLEAARGPGGLVVATVVEGSQTPGATLLVKEGGTVEGPLPPPGAGPDEARAAMQELTSAAANVIRVAEDALRRQVSRSESVLTSDAREVRIFLEVFPRKPTLVIFGGVHVAMALVPLAKALGYTTVVADGRQAFLTPDRFPAVDRLILGWPEQAFAEIGLDASSYVCVLSHDPKFDEPALQIALRSPAIYVGAIGSRKTQAARREKLRAAGLSEEQVARLRGPIGLNLGGRQPAETALAILAEMTAVRYGGDARPMTTG